MGDQFRAEGSGGRPVAAQHVLADGIGALRGQRSQSGLGSHGFGSGHIHVGGAVAQRLKTAQLRLLVGQVFRQFHRFHGMSGLGVHAQNLAAQEGTHLNLFAAAGEGGQLAGGVVVAQFFLHSGRNPRAADTGADGVADGALQKILPARKEGGMIAQRLDGFSGGQTLFVVEIADLLSVSIQRQLAAVAQEERGEVPAVGHVHVELLACLFGGGQNTVQRLHVLLGQDGLVIVEEVAVVGGHGVAVQHAVVGGGVDGSGGVFGDDLIPVAGHLIQRIGLHQLDDLVVRVGEHVRRCGGILQITGLRVGLAHHAVGELPLVFGMLGGKGVAKLLQQRLIGLGRPDFQFDRLRTGGGAQADHEKGHQHTKLFFHRFFPPFSIDFGLTVAFIIRL